MRKYFIKTIMYHIYTVFRTLFSIINFNTFKIYLDTKNKLIIQIYMPS